MVYSLAHRLGKGWDRQLEDGLPDCRLIGGRERTSVVLHGWKLERVFCANCGKPGGAVTEWTPHVFYICDDPDCIRTAPVTAILVPPPVDHIPERELAYGGNGH